MKNLDKFKLLSLLTFATAVACSNGGTPAEDPSGDTDDSSTDGTLGEEGPVEDVQPAEDPPALSDDAHANRPELTSEECQAQGGQVIGDIGDGAIYQEAYMCPSGQVPTGNIVASGDGPMAVEGAVCCP